jgi:hypothetical protein
MSVAFDTCMHQRQHIWHLKHQAQNLIMVACGNRRHCNCSGANPLHEQACTTNRSHAQSRLSSPRTAGTSRNQQHALLHAGACAVAVDAVAAACKVPECMGSHSATITPVKGDCQLLRYAPCQRTTPKSPHGATQHHALSQSSATAALPPTAHGCAADCTAACCAADRCAAAWLVAEEGG